MPRRGGERTAPGETTPPATVPGDLGYALHHRKPKMAFHETRQALGYLEDLRAVLELTVSGRSTRAKTLCYKIEVLVGVWCTLSRVQVLASSPGQRAPCQLFRFLAATSDSITAWKTPVPHIWETKNESTATVVVAAFSHLFAKRSLYPAPFSAPHATATQEAAPAPATTADQDEGVSWEERTGMHTWPRKEQIPPPSEQQQ